MNTMRLKLSGICLGLTLAAGLIGTARAQIKPWTVITDTSQRFQVLSSLNSAAVLDRETGLVWMKTPVSNTGQNFGVDWAFAIQSCLGQSIGGRPAWRIPTVEEMLSLLDYNVFGPDNSHLPLGHPFNMVLTDTIHYYWTSTTDPADPTKAYGVTVNANVSAPASFSKSDNRGIWCVRGGSN